MDVITIPGFQFSEEIGRSIHSIVYRAIHNDQPCVVKLPLPGAANHASTSLSEFRREACALALVQHPGLPAIIELGQVGGLPYMAMEYIHGLSLQERLTIGPLPFDQTLAVARTIAGALAAVHRQGVLHRDLQPRNILLGQHNSVKLIDFGFTTYKVSELTSAQILGTLRYSAPEQTGLIKRPVDARSDLYALGVILFECIHGKPPFLASNPTELIRQHAVMPPPNLRKVQPECSPGMAAIIARLLAKDPDDRYQTAEGLLSDLDQLEQFDAAVRRKQEIFLGLDDQHTAALYESELVGRASEVARLRELWTMARHNQGALALIEGSSGAGKSRLGREIAHRASSAGGLILISTCMKGVPTPFGVIRSALETYNRYLRRLPQVQRQDAEEQLQRLLRPIGTFMQRLVPDLKPILQHIDAGREIPVDHELVCDTLITALRQITRVHPGTVWLIDDIHDIDEASLTVVQRLIQQLSEGPLLLVATLDDTSQARQVREQLFQQDTGQIHLLSLHILDDREAHALIRTFLGGYRVDQRLVNEVIVRSAGSPLAIREYVRTVLDAGLLHLVAGTWTIAASDLRDLELPPQILPLLLRRVETIEPSNRSILCTAAVLGFKFRRTELIYVCDGADTEVNTALNEALRAHLLERSASGSYRFTHERVHAALMARIDNDGLRALHLQIAQMLDALKRNDQEMVYRLARHYNRGYNQHCLDRALQANLDAATMALQHLAYDEAFEFFNAAEQLSQRLGQPLDAPSEAAFGEVCYRHGNIPEAILHFERAINASTAPLERARLRIQRSSIQIWNDSSASNLHEIQHAFVELGESFPITRRERLFSIGGSLLRLLISRSVPRLRPVVRGKELERRTILQQLYEMVGSAAYVNGNGRLLFMMALASLANAERLGPSLELAKAHSIYAIYHALKQRERRALQHLEAAQRLLQQFNQRALQARILLFRGLTLEMLGYTNEAEQVLSRCLQEEERWLDMLEYSQGSSSLVWGLALRGHIYDAWEWNQRALRHVTQASNAQAALLYLPMSAAALLALLGNADLSREYVQQSVQLVRNVPHDIMRRQMFICSQLVIALAQQSSVQELELLLIEGSEIIPQAPHRVMFHLRHWYVLQAYARLVQAYAAPRLKRLIALKRLHRALRVLQQAATVPLFKAHALIIEAGVYSLSGQVAAAFSALSNAEALAYTEDMPWVLIEAASTRARMLMQQDNISQARSEARRAYQICTNQGWLVRARGIQSEYGLDDLEPRTQSAQLSGHGSPLAETLRTQRNLEALLNISRAWGRVHNPDEQLQIALDAIIRLLGAERGFLFLMHANGMEFQAGRDATGHDLHQLEGYSRTLVDRVMITRQAIVVSGSDDSMMLGLENMRNHQLRSVLAAPLLLDEARLLGVLYLDNRLVWGVFAPEDLDILQAVANHVALALETNRTAQLEISIEAERQQRRLAENLRRISGTLNTSLDLQVVLERALEALNELLPYTSGAIVLCRDDLARFVALRGQKNSESLRQMTINLSSDELFQSMHDTQHAIVIRDVGGDTRFRNYGGNQVSSWLGVPLYVRDTLVGFVALDRSFEEPFSERDAEIGMLFAAQAAVAIENARLFGEVRRLAITDGLTGVWNRRHFFEEGEREWQRTRRYDHPLSAMMLDVDHFKRINDTYGHATGDLVLVHLTRLCRSLLRDSDMLGRYGGEEFAILLPDTDLSAAHATAERIREVVAAAVIDDPGHTFSITISIGVASATVDMTSLAALLDRADRGLYLAKELGRNRVVMA